MSEWFFIFFLHIHKCVECVSGAQGGQEKVLDPLGLKLAEYCKVPCRCLGREVRFSVSSASDLNA